MDADKKPTVDTLEDEIDAIRIRNYEKTKNMTADEEADYFNQRARDILKAHGLTDVKFVEAPPRKNPPVSQA